ncbi:unnamed protein product, partial [Urochloa humidicola]
RAARRRILSPPQHLLPRPLIIELPSDAAAARADAAGEGQDGVPADPVAAPTTPSPLPPLPPRDATLALSALLRPALSTSPPLHRCPLRTAAPQGLAGARPLRTAAGPIRRHRAAELSSARHQPERRDPPPPSTSASAANRSAHHHGLLRYGEKKEPVASASKD